MFSSRNRSNVYIGQVVTAHGHYLCDGCREGRTDFDSQPFQLQTIIFDKDQRKFITDLFTI